MIQKSELKVNSSSFQVFAFHSFVNIYNGIISTTILELMLGARIASYRRGSLIEQYSAWEHAWDDREQHSQASRWNTTECKLLNNGVCNPAHATLLDDHLPGERREF